MATAQISLAALAHNLDLVRARIRPGTRVLAAVKANAYGHGAVPVAQHLERLGVNFFGVATAGEALELRSAGISTPILIFSPVYDRIPELAEAEVRLTLADETSLAAIRHSGAAVKLHLKVDTGMGRLGRPADETRQLARAAARTPGVALEGLWTHFAASDDADPTFTHTQVGAFYKALAALEEDGLQPEIVHAANSAAAFAYPEAAFDMVRPGIALYGYHSSSYIAGLEPGLKPALTLSAPVTFIKRVKQGTPISYSLLWRAPADTTIATVRIGYADGYPRLLTGKGTVLLNGVERPIAGRVCMDQLMVDAGLQGVQVGDRVTLFGPGPLGAETLAGRIGTISYELLTSLSSRVERVYLP